MCKREENRGRTRERERTRDRERVREREFGSFILQICR